MEKKAVAKKAVAKKADIHPCWKRDRGSRFKALRWNDSIAAALHGDIQLDPLGTPSHIFLELNGELGRFPIERSQIPPLYTKDIECPEQFWYGSNLRVTIDPSIHPEWSPINNCSCSFSDPYESDEEPKHVKREKREKLEGRCMCVNNCPSNAYVALIFQSAYVSAPGEPAYVDLVFSTTK